MNNINNFAWIVNRSAFTVIRDSVEPQAKIEQPSEDDETVGQMGKTVVSQLNDRERIESQLERVKIAVTNRRYYTGWDAFAEIVRRAILGFLTLGVHTVASLLGDIVNCCIDPKLDKREKNLIDSVYGGLVKAIQDVNMSDSKTASVEGHPNNLKSTADNVTDDDFNNLNVTSATKKYSIEFEFKYDETIYYARLTAMNKINGQPDATELEISSDKEHWRFAGALNCNLEQRVKALKQIDFSTDKPVDGNNNRPLTGSGISHHLQRHITLEYETTVGENWNKNLPIEFNGFNLYQSIEGEAQRVEFIKAHRNDTQKGNLVWALVPYVATSSKTSTKIVLLAVKDNQTRYFSPRPLTILDEVDSREITSLGAAKTEEPSEDEESWQNYNNERLSGHYVYYMVAETMKASKESPSYCIETPTDLVKHFTSMLPPTLRLIRQMINETSTKTSDTRSAVRSFETPSTNYTGAYAPASPPPTDEEEFLS